MYNNIIKLVRILSNLIIKLFIVNYYIVFRFGYKESGKIVVVCVWKYS